MTHTRSRSRSSRPSRPWAHRHPAGPWRRALAVRTVAACAALVALGACAPTGPSALTVKGRVLGVFGEPIPGATVVVHGVGTATTGPDGRFEVADVAMPYDLTALDATAGWSHTFVGLTDATPEVFPVTTTFATPGVATATVTGQLDALVDANHTVQVCAQGVSVAVYGCTRVYPGFADYAITVNWREGSTVEVRLRALDYAIDPVTASATALAGSAASGVVTLTEGGVSDIDLVMGAPVATASFDVTVKPAFAPDEFQAAAVTHVDAFGSMSGGDARSTVPTFSVFTARFTDATYTVAGIAMGTQGSGVHWRTGVPQGASLEFEPPAPAVLLSPADGATNVAPGDGFALTNPSGGVTTVLFLPDATGPYLAVSTVSQTVQLPDLAAYGLPLPASAGYQWTVFSSPGTPAMNAAVSGTGPLGDWVRLSLAASFGGPAPTADGTIALAGYRSFTTAP